MVVVSQVSRIHLPEDGMVEDIEELRAELGGHSFLDFKVLGHAHVPSTEIRVAENVPADIPQFP